MARSGAERDDAVMGIIFNLMAETGREMVARDAALARADGIDAQQVDDSVEMLAGNGRIRVQRTFGGGWFVTWMSEYELAGRFAETGVDVLAEQKRVMTDVVDSGAYTAVDGTPALLVQAIIRNFVQRELVQGHLGFTGQSFVGHVTAKGRRWLEEVPEFPGPYPLY